MYKKLSANYNMSDTILKIQMPRKRITYAIDERIGDLIAKLAEQEGISRNRFLEKHFAQVGIRLGLLPSDFKQLGETRGGDRKSAQAKEQGE